MADASAPPEKRARTEELVVYPGEEGSLAHIAATRFLSSHQHATLKGVTTFATTIKEVAEGRALYGVVPIENSSSGPISATYDLLIEYDVVVGGELGIREKYCLCAKNGVPMSKIKRVFSHPNIIEACSNFLHNKVSGKQTCGVETNATRSTTEATKRVAEESAEEGSAAIATREAAKRFGLEILASDIGNDDHLETRYILIHGRKGPAASCPSPFPRDAVSPVRKHFACFVLKHEPASIFKLLSVWALRNIDILKMETRPLHGGHKGPRGFPQTVHLWDWVLFIEYAVPPGQSEEANTRLWEATKEFSLWQRDFGIYPSQVTRVIKQAQSWEELVDVCHFG